MANKLNWLCWSLFLLGLSMPVFSFVDANPVTGKIVMLFNLAIPADGITNLTPLVFPGWRLAMIMLFQAPLFAGLTLKGLALLSINIALLSLTTSPFSCYSTKWTKLISIVPCLLTTLCLSLLVSQQPLGIQANAGAYLWLLALSVFTVTRILLVVSKASYSK